ncbi:CBS domain-containing protein [Pectinatus haikarae]|uniref:Acetoin utilization protein AcuB n=1 Tax=Pectinatus haikarae TaxID=349096 RepID=A0ABT9Y594_9FIRM|nr:CBS domain-containing protein [Pectinatus haikarae]MDQ0202998.1 acetoin utilization protein AcuB [Pectinatus haikarae]
MFVSSYMTRNPITVSADTPVDEAAGLMKMNHFRRLPVMKDGKVVGIISDRDISRIAPSPATTLAKYEINSLLAKMPVSDVMSAPIVCVSDEATVEEAALLMCNNKIGGMPVVSSVGVLVGIITETDIFRVLVKVMGLASGKMRVTLDFKDKIGATKEIADVFAKHQLNIDSFVSFNTPNGDSEAIIRGTFPDLNEITVDLQKLGYKVSHITKIGML